MATQIPDRIREAMAEMSPPIKTLGQLVARMGHPSASVYRVFAGQNNHTTLRTYKRIAEICGWTLEQFFVIAQGNQPENIAQFLRGRLKTAEISVSDFCAYLYYGTKGGGGGFEYLDGSHRYERLSLYSSMRTALGITADELCESLIISDRLTKPLESGKLHTSKRLDEVNTYSTHRRAS
jgi:hypothetical protein